jgi:amino acid transporter
VFENINIWLIVRDHIETWKNYDTGRTSIEDILVFVVTPFLAAPFLVFGLNFRLDAPAINVLITSLSVFSALLFNLLLLIFDILRKESGEQKRSALRRQFLSYIYSNISFGILTAVVSIAMLLLLFIKTNLPYFTEAVNLAVDFLVINFILTMLMIVKRVHILLRKEIPPTLDYRPRGDTQKESKMKP